MKKSNFIKGAALTLACASLATFTFAACTNTSQNESDNTSLNKNAKTIVATVFPCYDYMKNIIGESDNFNLELLVDKGVDLHSYEPSVADVVKIKEADMFVYIGGESEDWVDDVLSDINNEEMVVLNLMDELGSRLKEEEIIEGMQDDEHEHEHENENEEMHEDDEDELTYDEHVWLSLTNAKIFVDKLAKEVASLDKNNEAKYLENAKAYNEKLDLLDAEYKEVVNNAKNNTLIFADRFPFRYLVDDYNLDYYAAFSGCSAESEASFATIAFLADKLDELELKYLLKLENSSDKLATTVIDSAKNKDITILSIDSMQSVDKKDLSSLSYLSIMQKNLDVLKTALN